MLFWLKMVQHSKSFCGKFTVVLHFKKVGVMESDGEKHCLKICFSFCFIETEVLKCCVSLRICLGNVDKLRRDFQQPLPHIFKAKHLKFHTIKCNHWPLKSGIMSYVIYGCSQDFFFFIISSILIWWEHWKSQLRQIPTCVTRKTSDHRPATGILKTELQIWCRFQEHQTDRQRKTIKANRKL